MSGNFEGKKGLPGNGKWVKGGDFGLAGNAWGMDFEGNTGAKGSRIRPLLPRMKSKTETFGFRLRFFHEVKHIHQWHRPAHATCAEHLPEPLALLAFCVALKIQTKVIPPETSARLNDTLLSPEL